MAAMAEACWVLRRGAVIACVFGQDASGRAWTAWAGSSLRVKGERCDGDAPRRNEPRLLFRASTWFSAAHYGSGYPALRP
jgi:hypothetical protein